MDDIRDIGSYNSPKVVELTRNNIFAAPSIPPSDISCSQSTKVLLLIVESITFCLRVSEAIGYCCNRITPMILHNLTYCRKNWTWTWFGRNRASSSSSSSTKSSVLMCIGRPKATATDRSRVNSIYHVLFYIRLLFFVN